MTPVTNYMLLYSTLLCKKIARAPGGHKTFMFTKLGGRNRIDPVFVALNSECNIQIKLYQMSAEVQFQSDVSQKLH